MHRHVFHPQKMYDLIFQHLVLKTECTIMLIIECIINTQFFRTQALFTKMSSCQVCGQGEEGTILDFPARTTSDFYILFLV